MIYLASPYTHPDPKVREERFEAACQAVADMMTPDRTVYSPIVHGHPLVRFGLPVEWEWWEPHARSFLPRCDGVVVLTLDGWRESIGVKAEIALARGLEKPIGYLAPPRPTWARVAAESRP